MNYFYYLAIIAYALFAGSFISNDKIFITKKISINHSFPKVSIIFAIGIFGIIIPTLTNKSSEFINVLNIFPFNKLVIDFLLPFLLFAGSIGLKRKEMLNEKQEILILSIISCLLSIFLITVISFFITSYFNFSWSLISCLILGAIISPTDPVSTLSLIKKYNMPNRITNIIAGESLFNDAVDLVLFNIAISLLNTHNLNLQEIISIFFYEIILGAILGYISAYILSYTTVIKNEIYFSYSLIITFLIYTLINQLNISGPIAIIIAGIQTRYILDKNCGEKQVTKFIKIWEKIEDLLNDILYYFMGLSIILIPYGIDMLIISIISTIATIIVRLVSIYLPFRLFNIYQENENVIPLLTWGGLRGALTLSMALQLPNIVEKNIFLCITYTVLISSILIQGTTLTKAIKNASK